MSSVSDSTPVNPNPIPPSAQGSGMTALRVIVVAAVGLAAAAAASVLIGRMGEVFVLPTELVNLGIGQIPGAEDQRRITAGNEVLKYKNSALWIAVAGLIIGGAVGAAIGMFRRTRRAVLYGLAGGASGGAVFGALAGPAGVYLDAANQAGLSSGALAISDGQMMMMHGTVWMLVGIGCAAGAALSAPERSGRSIALAVLIAGVAGALGGLLYPVAAGLMLPLADPSVPIPRELNERLVWSGLPAMMIGLALGRRG